MENHYGSLRIVIAPSQYDEQEVVTHELNHWWQGDFAFNEAFSDIPHIANAVYEASTTQVELYLNRGGDLQTIDPTTPLRQNGPYPLFRDMLDLLANGGEEKIPMHDIIKAIDTDNGGDIDGRGPYDEP